MNGFALDIRFGHVEVKLNNWVLVRFEVTGLVPRLVQSVLVIFGNLAGNVHKRNSIALVIGHSFETIHS